MTSTLTDKVKRAYQYAPMPGVEPDDDSLTAFIRNTPYVEEKGDGFLLGAVYPFHLNNDVLIAGVLMMDGRGHGEELLNGFRDWAKEKGASLMQVSIADFSSDTFFSDRGYREVEHMHMRGI